MELTENILEQFYNLKMSLPEKLFIDNMKRQLPKYTLNMKFINLFRDCLGDWVSYSDIKDDTIEYLINHNLFNYEKWKEASEFKSKDLFINKVFQDKYSEYLPEMLQNIRFTSFKLLSYFLDQNPTDEIALHLLKTYCGFEDASKYFIKYGYLLGPSILRVASISDNLIKGNETFDQLFLSEKPVDIETFFEVVARGAIPVNKINKVFDKNNFILNLNTKHELEKKDNDEYVHKLLEESEDKLENIRERYGLQIFTSFISVFNGQAPVFIQSQSLLLDLLNYEIPENILLPLYQIYINCGLYQELCAYSKSHNYTNLDMILVLN